MTTTQTQNPTRYSIRHPHWNLSTLSGPLTDANVRQVADALVETYGGTAEILVDRDDRSYVVETHFAIPGVAHPAYYSSGFEMYGSFEITAPLAGYRGNPFRFLIDSGHRGYSSGRAESGVNWSAAGTQPVETAREFAAALAFCADVLAWYEAIGAPAPSKTEE